MTRAAGVLGLIALSLFAIAGALYLVWPSLWSSLLALVIAEQQQIHRALTSSVTQLKTEGSLTAAFALGAFSFAYGVFHALGPGHGKAVIGSYLLATGDTVRRGVVLAFVSALVQGFVAIVLVTVVVALLAIPARTATTSLTWLELISYALMAAAGAYLLWRKANEIWFATPALAQTVPVPHLGVDHVHSADCDHAHGPAPVVSFSASPEIAAVQHQHSEHVHTADCGHAHMPGADIAAKPLSLGSLVGIVAAIGIRPCMGAILVLVFALTQGLYFAGVTAVIAMSIGTAITVSALAVLTVLARGEGLRKLMANETWFANTHHALGIIGAVALLSLGVLFFIAALVAPPANPLGIAG
jgi:ABC-type nickel/cobalt efflux system permease component RcnA